MKLVINAYLLCWLHYSVSLSLLEKHPSLQHRIAHVSLCDLPTPIIKADHVGERLGYQSIYIKRDDYTGGIVCGNRLYGGNKPRKLEWLLADALQQNAHTVVTYGCAGSNHALATAVYAHELGFKAILMLKPQPNSHVVRKNLLLDYATGAELQAFPDNATRDCARKQLVEQDAGVYFIPTGGSTPLGTLGFVNAAYELCAQVEAARMPKPDVIYLPIGSCATTAGLLLGFALQNMPIRIQAIAVEPEDEPNEFVLKTQQLFKEANILLHNADSTIPLVDFPDHLFAVNKQFWGARYGLWMDHDRAAMDLLYDTEHLVLEGTYSTKPWCALIDDIQQGRLHDEVVLVWHTYCDYSEHADALLDGYRTLPGAFQYYFVTDVH